MQTSMMGFVIIYKKETATATETNPTNVAYAAGQASQMEIVTAMETVFLKQIVTVMATNLTSVAFVEETEQLV